MSKDHFDIFAAVWLRHYNPHYFVDFMASLGKTFKYVYLSITFLFVFISYCKTESGYRTSAVVTGLIGFAMLFLPAFFGAVDKITTGLSITKVRKELQKHGQDYATNGDVIDRAKELKLI